MALSFALMMGNLDEPPTKMRNFIADGQKLLKANHLFLHHKLPFNLNQLEFEVYRRHLLHQHRHQFGEEAGPEQPSLYLQPL